MMRSIHLITYEFIFAIVFLDTSVSRHLAWLPTLTIGYAMKEHVG